MVPVAALSMFGIALWTVGWLLATWLFWLKRNERATNPVFTVITLATIMLAVASGADALIVSNHGGRQLDGAESSIRALPRIVDAVGGQIEVHMDGGIRSGQDVLKARALGAQGTYIGRAFLYGLGAMGGAGVSKALELIQRELDLTMAFCGHTDIKTVDKGILLPGTF